MADAGVDGGLAGTRPGALARGAEAVLIFLVFSGPPTLRIRELGASLRGAVDLAAAVQVAVWLAAGLWVARFFLRRPAGAAGITLRLPRLPLAVLLGCCCGLWLAFSSLRSPAPAFTLFRALQFLLGCLVAYFFVRERGLEGSLRFLRGGLALLGYAIYLALALRPQLVLEKEGYFGIRGDAVAPAAVVGLLLFVLVASWPFAAPAAGARGLAPRARRWLRAPLENRAVLLALSLSLVLLSRRRVGMLLLAVILVAAAILVGRLWPLKGQLALAAGLVGGILGAWIAWGVVASWVIRDPRQLANVSDRLPLWTHMVQRLWEEGPLTGLGFVARTRILGPQINPALGNAHSDFVEVLVGGGLPAFLCYVAVWLLVLGRATLGALRGGTGGAALFLMAIALFGYALMTSHGTMPTPAAFAFWMLVALCSEDRRRRWPARASVP